MRPPASGMMQVWRMRADGSQQEQVTSDEFNNWFPHPSPDGKQLVFLSFPKGTKGHDGRMKIQLRMMEGPSGKKQGSIQTLAEITGGQGTINVNSWSPDSKKFAFVTYELE